MSSLVKEMTYTLFLSTKALEGRSPKVSYNRLSG